MSPFYANLGYHPRCDFLLPPDASVSNPAVADLLTRIKENQELLKTNLEKALADSKKYADRRRSPAPDYQPGDLVWLSRKNIKTTRPCNKLDFKKLGPYRIEAKINDVA